MHLRRLASLTSLCAGILAGCADADDSGSDASGDAVTERKLALDVGVESSRTDPILTMGRPSARNMYSLAVASAAAYADGAALHDALCEAGIQPRESAPCPPGHHIDAELATFDTSFDDHATYFRGMVETSSGPKEVGVLAFRGTGSTAAAAINAQFGMVAPWGQDAGDPELDSKQLPGAVHGGFVGAASRLWRGETPDKSLRTFLLERHGRPDAPPLYVTGHSLGAAIGMLTVGFMLFGECSSIATGEIFGAPRPVVGGELAWTLPGTSCPEKSRFRIEALYTYGSPRIGDNTFAEALGNMLALRRVGHFRVVNANDIVTRIAPRFTGYAHVHLNIQGLTDRGREYGLREDENADAFYGRRPSGELVLGKCRQWKDASDNPAACPTSSLAYLLSGDVASERHRTEVLRLGSGATEALDADWSFFGSTADHRLIHYVPLLKKILPSR